MNIWKFRMQITFSYTIFLIDKNTHGTVPPIKMFFVRMILCSEFVVVWYRRTGSIYYAGLHFPHDIIVQSRAFEE